MTPFTAIADFTCGDSNQSSSRSAMLIVIRRVTSPTVFTFIPRFRQTSFSSSITSDGFLDPMFGGTVRSNGPSTSARPLSQASHFGIASASCFDHFAISS